MALREFIDADGMAWRVWSTRPTSGVSLQESFRLGWLTFESATQRRRIAPVPAGWETAPDNLLEALCRSATAVARPDGAGGSQPGRSATRPPSDMNAHRD